MPPLLAWLGAALCYECNELENASQYLLEAITISQPHHLMHHEVHATIALVRVLQAQGQIVVAQQRLSDLFDVVEMLLLALISYWSRRT